MNENLINIGESQPVRLIDNATNTIVFEGVGYDAADRAMQIAQGMSDEMGGDAQWSIQTKPSGDALSMYGSGQTSDWSTVAQENKNQGVIGTIGDIAGTALPLAVSLIPGLQVLGPIASSALAGGAGAALRGDNILKGAAMGGLSAAGGELLGPVLEGAGIGAKTATALGTGIGSTAGGLATGQSLQNSLLGGAAAGGLSYFGGDIRNALGISGAPASSGGDGGGGAAPADTIVVTGYGGTPVSVPIGGSGNKAPTAPQDGEIIVTANGSGGVGIGYLPSSVSPSVNVPQSILDYAAQPQAAPDEIVLTGQTQPAVGGIGGSVVADGAVKPTADNPFPENTLVEAGQEPPPVTAGIGGVTGGGTDPVTGEQNEIIVTKDGEVIGLTPPIIPDVGPFDVSTDITNTVKDVQVPPDPNKGMTAADYVKLALNAANVLGAIGGAGGGGGALGPDNSAISYIPLNRQQRTRTPAGAGLGAYGFDPFTYGQAGGDQPGEYLFFEAGPAVAPVTPAVTAPSGALQFAEGGSPNSMSNKDLVASFTSDENNPAVIREINQRIQDKLLDRFNGDRKAAAAFLRETNDPLSVLNDYAEGGDVDDDMVKHLIEYRKGGGHNGPGKVKGIGSGQEDKIPAWLSDGEYVWSAQDVADLGDGSTDEGVRRLDKMRQMVRHRAGRKDVKKIAKPQKGIDSLLAAVGGK